MFASLVSVDSVSASTNVFDSDLRAVLALYCAAPVELAIAATHYLCAPLFHPQTALMAQPAAASPFPLSETFPMLHALPTLCARKPEAQVLGTIIRRLLQIYELRPGDGAERVCNGHPIVCAVARAHSSLVHFEFLGLVVLYFKVISNLTEIRKLHPARLHCATFWHAMAPTDPLHGCLYSLEHEVGYC